MSSLLVLLLGQSPADPIRWGLLDDGRLMEGGRLAGADELEALAASIGDVDAVAAVLPGEQAAMRRMPAPPRSAAKFKSAAIYLLEDELAQPTDDLHVAIAQEGGQGLVVAVEAALLDDWLARLAAVGLDPQVLSVDYLLLPAAAGEGAFILEEGRIVCRLEGTGFAIEEALYETVAKSLFTEPLLRASYFGPQHKQAMLPLAEHVEWGGEADDATLLAAFGAQATARGAPNLLQGRYRRRRSFAPALAHWRRSAALAAACLLALFGVVMADGLRAARTADRLETSAQALHAKSFPSAANADPARHARSVLSAGAGGGGFLALSNKFANAIGEEKKVQIDRISFDASRGQFVASVRSASDIDIENLKKRLAEQGVVARDSGGYRRSGEHWVGELTVANQ